MKSQNGLESLSILPNETIESLANKLKIIKRNKDELFKNKYNPLYCVSIKLKDEKAILIQRFYRGFILRKAFKNRLYEINKNIVIEYFVERRKENIRKNYLEIISRNLNKYLNYKRIQRRRIIEEYLNFCTTLITKTIKGHILRKQLRYQKVLNKSIKINGIINCFRVRLILKSRLIQDILKEIAILKQSDEKAELNQLLYSYNRFYTEFYRINHNKTWTRYSRVDKGWYDNYKLLLTKGKDKQKLIEVKNINVESHSESELHQSEIFHTNQTENKFQNFVLDNKLTREEIPKNVNYDYDLEERPIKTNNHYEYNEEQELPSSSDVVTKNKKKVENRLRRKIPKYDAEKAIKEAVKNKPDKNKIEERGAFRQFLQSIKNGSDDCATNLNTNKKANLDSEFSSTNSNKIEILNDDKISEPLAKKETKKIKMNNLRKKLHMLEKSAPPKIDLKNVRSKIDCWGSENDNLYSKKSKKEESAPYVYKAQSFIQELEREFHLIDEKFNSEKIFKNKKIKMKEYPDIPFISLDSFYVKNYSNEIYESLSMHLHKHYDELKN